jgi:endonuclease/exonuclease/phosphatase family metal-dependent hydrolase
MNCDAANPVIVGFKNAGWRDAYEAVHGSEGDGFTWHNFEGEFLSSHRELGRIDWIFLRGRVTARDAEIVRDSESGRYPSDHYFVCAEVAFGES